MIERQLQQHSCHQLFDDTWNRSENGDMTSSDNNMTSLENELIDRQSRVNDASVVYRNKQHSAVGPRQVRQTLCPALWSSSPHIRVQHVM